jgi:putative ABC transport system ATP-binding protein
MITTDLQDRSAVQEHDPDRGAAVAVELCNVTKRYGRRRHAVEALHDVSATFRTATLTAVMGLSGSGKSTLLQCAAGLDHPTSGSVRLGGVELKGMSRRRLTVLRRRQVGFVFQSLNLVPTLSVAENIALPLRLDHRHVDRRQVRAMAERVGIAGLFHRLPDTLSGGQQQRVAIARALIIRPAVIFADEPTAALDPYTAEGILALLRHAVDELGQTVVLVTHDPAVAAQADRVLLLHHGLLAGDITQPEPSVLVDRLHYLAQEVAR